MPIIDLQEGQPVMTTIGNRPAKVARLHNINETYVQCRLPNGEDAYVPLSDISELIINNLLDRFPKYQEPKSKPV